MALLGLRDQSCPALEAVLEGHDPLRIVQGELGGEDRVIGCCDELRHGAAEALRCPGSPRPEVAQQVLGLLARLFEIEIPGVERLHDTLLPSARRSRDTGERVPL